MRSPPGGEGGGQGNRRRGGSEVGKSLVFRVRQQAHVRGDGGDGSGVDSAVSQDPEASEVEEEEEKHSEGLRRE